jgi:hypothetical protein
MKIARTEIVDNSYLQIEFDDGTWVVIDGTGKVFYFVWYHLVPGGVGRIVGDFETIVWPDKTELNNAILDVVHNHPVGRRWKEDCWDLFRKPE